MVANRGLGTNRGVLVGQLKRANKTHEIDQLLPEILKSGRMDGKEYTMAIAAYGRAGQPGRALDLLDELSNAPNCRPDVYSFTSTIAACGADFQKANEVLRRMEAAGVAPNLRTYSALINAASKSGLWREATQLLETMQRSGITPDIIIFNATITACARGGAADKAISLLQGLPGALNPNVVTYSSAISACEKARKWQEALELLNDMLSRGIKADVTCFNAAISACEKCGQWSKALDLMKKMSDKGCTPDAITYSAAISACGNGQQWEHSLNLLKEMEARGLKADTVAYNAAMTACNKASQPEYALKLFSEQQEKGIRISEHSYSAAINACAAMKQWERAIGMLNEVEAQHPVNDDNRSGRAFCYSAALKACGNAQKAKPALDLLARMKSRGVPTDTACYLPAIVACSAEYEKALDLIEELGSKADSGCFNAAMQAIEHAVRARSTGGDLKALLEAGMDLLYKAHAIKEVRDDSYHVHMTLHNACKAAGDEERAKEVSRFIQSLGLSSIAAVATATVKGEERTYEDGVADGETPESYTSSDLWSFWHKVVEETEYKPCLDAVPLGARKELRETSMESSLRHHAEKKALVDLLSNHAEDLTLRVNLKMCVDCIAFFNGAARVLNRRVTVHEPKRVHVFDPKPPPSRSLRPDDEAYALRIEKLIPFVVKYGEAMEATVVERHRGGAEDEVGFLRKGGRGHEYYKSLLVDAVLGEVS